MSDAGRTTPFKPPRQPGCPIPEVASAAPPRRRTLPSRSIMRLSLATLCPAIPALVSAQQTERVTLDGRDIAIYNLVGRLTVEGGTGDKVVVEVTRGGRDASRLKVQTGEVRGHNALRVIYPSDRIYYSDTRWSGRTTFTVDDDGTF